MIMLRALQMDELTRIGEIERAEHVTLVYRVEDGVLVSEAIDSEAERRSAERIAGFVRRLVIGLQSGGVCFGAEDSAESGRLVGVASLGAERVATGCGGAVHLGDADGVSRGLLPQPRCDVARAA